MPMQNPKPQIEHIKNCNECPYLTLAPYSMTYFCSLTTTNIKNIDEVAEHCPGWKSPIIITIEGGAEFKTDALKKVSN